MAERVASSEEEGPFELSRKNEHSKYTCIARAAKGRRTAVIWVAEISR